MKKKKYSIMISFIVVLLAIVIASCSNNKTPSKKEDTGVYTLTIIASEGVSVSLGTYNTSLGKEEDVTKVTSKQYNKNEYAYISTSSLIEGASFIGKWYQQSGDYIVEKEGVVKETLAYKMTQDVTLYAFYKTPDQHVVTYLSSNITKNIFMIEIVSDGAKAKGFNPPHKNGFDFASWSEDLSCVTSDMEVTPSYKHSMWTVFRDYWSFFLMGLGKTLLFSIISVFASLILGAVVCFFRIAKNPLLNLIGTAYVEVIRGVPSLLLLLIIYSLVPRIALGPVNTEIVACVLAMFINSSAYVAEIYRSGIQAVDKGQMEASRALGIGYWPTMFKVIIPQAIKNVLPSIGNELIMVIKETSLASQIDAGIGELMSVKRQITAVTLINLEPYFIIAIIYFIVTFSLSKCVRLVEKRLESHEQ